MKWESTGRGTEVRLVHDTRRCAGCQGLLVAPHARFGTVPCSCRAAQNTDGSCHLRITCKDCGREHLEPPCEMPGVGTDYFGS